MIICLALGVSASAGDAVGGTDARPTTRDVVATYSVGPASAQDFPAVPCITQGNDQSPQTALGAKNDLSGPAGSLAATRQCLDLSHSTDRQLAAREQAAAATLQTASVRLQI